LSGLDLHDDQKLRVTLKRDLKKRGLMLALMPTLTAGVGALVLLSAPSW